MKKQDLKHAARGGESSSPDPVLNIVTKNVLKSPIKIYKKNKKKFPSKFWCVYLFSVNHFTTTPRVSDHIFVTVHLFSIACDCCTSYSMLLSLWLCAGENHTAAAAAGRLPGSDQLPRVSGHLTWTGRHQPQPRHQRKVNQATFLWKYKLLSVWQIRPDPTFRFRKLNMSLTVRTAILFHLYFCRQDPDLRKQNLDPDSKYLY